MKLTDAQTRLIRSMRDGWQLAYTYTGWGMSPYRLEKPGEKQRPIRMDTVQILRKRNLIEPRQTERTIGRNVVRLTRLGKRIALSER